MKQIRKILYNAWTMAALSMLAAVVGVLTSCEEHSDIYDNTLKVGNIYLSNDRVVSPEGYNPDTDDAVGVIFFVKEDTALVVGKQEMGSYIYSDSLGTIPNVVNDVVSLVRECRTLRPSALQSLPSIFLRSERWKQTLRRSRAGACLLPVT
jgi:hypothetical protein